MRIRKEEMARRKRCGINFLRHMTPKKALNLVRVEYKLVKRDPCLYNIYPYLLIVEPSNACNLRCPLCQTGQGRSIPRKNLMSLQNYISLIDPFKEYLLQVFLYNWGEPFLNQDIYEIIRFNTAHNIGTVVSSNFNIHIDGKKLVENRLEHLIVSGDGITQEVYEKYRVGGKLDLVMGNLKEMIKAKKEAGSDLPYIEWQCLVNRWNEGRLDDIRNAVLELGADEVRFGSINFYSAENRKKAEEEWLPRNSRYRAFASEFAPRGERHARPCFWLWRSVVLNADGGITPCCLFDVPNWGNLFDEKFSSIWNNERYVEARQRSGNNGKARKMRLICDSCTNPAIYK